MKYLFTLAAVLAWQFTFAQERILMLNEGNSQSDNGRITYFEDGRIVSNQWFRDVNGYKLGDTPNDIISVNDNLLAIGLNTSNIIQFITAEGKAVAATEGVPNNRQLASDGKYVYVTSFAHEVEVNGSTLTFTKGYVAKIDVATYKVVGAVEVGYEPDGIACYDGYVFAANSGGYAFSEDHDYESTVSMIDAATMKVARTIDTGQINLSGVMSQSGKYLCINSPGDYYDVAAATIIFDCEAAVAGKSDSQCFVKLDKPSTYNCVSRTGSFYAVGSTFSYNTFSYEYNFMDIGPAKAFASDGAEGVSESLPGTMVEDFKNITTPYGIYVNPYTGYIYATDAGEFVSNGLLYQWSPEGRLLGSYKVYTNPGHLCALKPEGWTGIDNIAAPQKDSLIYNLKGMRVSNPQPRQIYIQNGKKIMYTK